MTIGEIQPNETVLYRYDQSEPSYIRRIYTFEGLTQLNIDPDEDQIRGMCQNATGDALPAPGTVLRGLPMARTSVRRYDGARGEARITVEWGERFFSGGAAPDVVRQFGSSKPEPFSQPYAVIFTGVGPSIFERRDRTIRRGLTTVTFQKLMDESAALTLLDSTINQNEGRLMLWNGINRVISGGYTVPVGQTQAYLSIVLVHMSPVGLVASGSIYNQGQYVSAQVSALAANQVYREPNASSGTTPEPLSTTYNGNPISTFGWMTS